MRLNILCGGPAGQGPNFLSEIISRGLIEKGFYVFSSREYESRIRGGHNFSLITFSDSQISSNSKGIDILVCLDENTYAIHKKELKKSSIVLKGFTENMHYAGALFKILGIGLKILQEELKDLENYKENLAQSEKGYTEEKRHINLPKANALKSLYFMNGSEAVAYGAVSSGLQFYYGYPMTPATGLLFELSKRESKEKYTTIELEGEIASINAAIGSSIGGTKSMVGTSGGGFDLMTESLSLCGMAQIPLVLYLAQRPGPGTGVATCTSQSDLSMARHAGHGEFSRVVVAPGDALEAIEKTSEAFYLSQKYRLPTIILSDKHLAESAYSFSQPPKLTPSKNSLTWPARFSSYESDENKISVFSPEKIKKGMEKRLQLSAKISAEINNLESFKIYGKKDSKNIILAWGSTKGAIVDAIKGLDCKFLQILYLEPLSKKISSELKSSKNIILIENNSTSQLSSLISEKTGFSIPEKNKILRYDGRPFILEDLISEIKRRLK